MEGWCDGRGVNVPSRQQVAVIHCSYTIHARANVLFALCWFCEFPLCINMYCISLLNCPLAFHHVSIYHNSFLSSHPSTIYQSVFTIHVHVFTPITLTQLFDSRSGLHKKACPAKMSPQSHTHTLLPWPSITCASLRSCTVDVIDVPSSIYGGDYVDGSSRL